MEAIVGGGFVAVTVVLFGIWRSLDRIGDLLKPSAGVTLSKPSHSISEVLNTPYPVFSEKSIADAYLLAVERSQALQQVESALHRESTFTQSARQHAIPDDVAAHMLRVTEALVEAEKVWYRHSAMLDANISVLTGKATRDQALAEAQKRFRTTDGFLSGDAERLRNEWKARLENATAPAKDPSPRAYSNPWFELAHHRFHW